MLKKVTGRGQWSGSLWVAAALILLTLLGGTIRFYRLGTQSLWIDEGFSLAQTNAILRHGYPLEPTGQARWSYFPAHYLMAAGVAVFPDTETGARFFPALAGTLLIPLLFAVTRGFFASAKWALLPSFLLAFFEFEVAWSRQARGYTILQAWIFLSLFFLYRFLADHRRRSLVLMCVFTLLSVLTHRGGYLGVAVIGLTLTFESAVRPSQRMWIKHHRRLLLLSSLLVLITAASLSLLLPANSPIIDTWRYVIHPSGFDYVSSYARFLNNRMYALLAWVLLGAAFLLAEKPVRGAPLVISTSVFLYIISLHSRLFHFRYLLPVIPLLLFFAAYGYVSLATLVPRTWKTWSRVWFSAVSLTFALSVATASFQWKPSDIYYLGNTAPQPEWERAYEWILSDIHRRGHDDSEIATISTFPFFHDIYIDDAKGKKYFLPFSLAGLPGDTRERALYSDAATVDSLTHFRALSGYVVLDELGWQRLKDAAIRRFLKAATPQCVIGNDGDYYIFIWRLSGASGNRRILDNKAPFRPYSNEGSEHERTYPVHIPRGGCVGAPGRQFSPYTAPDQPEGR